MSVITVDSIGRVETSPGRRTMKVCAERLKRRHYRPRSPPIQRVMTNSTLPNGNPGPYRNVERLTTWVLPSEQEEPIPNRPFPS